jgi:NAD(P)-dependent dehydrogenase (short-subunit alcohol dehydrogenase family)
MDLGLKGKAALVTGGTRGIGRAIALSFAAEGADVAVCARNAADVSALVRDLEASGVRAFGQALDVTEGAALAGFVTAAAARFGRLDVVVANASALASGSTEESFRAAFETDVLHTRCLAEAAIPHLERSGAGSFLAISSISGSEDYGYDSVAYGAMKAALFFYVKSLARSLAGRGVRANVVSPGTTYFKGGFWHQVEIEDPGAFATAVADNPMGRMARPEEIADLAVFVSSPRASFVSGANLVVDGTMTMRIPN